MLRINPHQTALWRDLNSLQIGSGNQKVIFNSLSPAQERLIAALYRGIADKQLPKLMDDLGLEPLVGQTLVDSLEPLLLRDTAPLKKPLSEDFVAGAFAEIIRASLLNSADGATVLMERKFRTVHVDDLSGAGLALTKSPMPASCGWRPVMSEARVGQQRAELVHFSKRAPDRARRSRWGVGISPP